MLTSCDCYNRISWLIIEAAAQTSTNSTAGTILYLDGVAFIRDDCITASRRATAATYRHDAQAFNVGQFACVVAAISKVDAVGRHKGLLGCQQDLSCREPLCLLLQRNRSRKYVPFDQNTRPESLTCSVHPLQVHLHQCSPEPVPWILNAASAS